MQWFVLELEKYFDDSLAFVENLDVKTDLMARNKDILDVSLAKVDGNLYVNKSKYILHYQAYVTLTLPSTRSLKPVSLPMKFSVDETFMTQEQFDKRDELIKEDEVLIIEEQIIDLDDSVKDNILLSIPLKVLSEEEKNDDDYLQGKTWQVISESQYKILQKEKPNSPFDELKDLFEE
ncbi:MAG: YceD family protein [Lactobacillales bacterium]|jgi:uncharacterized protein|nr:YceD family protein [Lactobacillales bacterium]